MHSERAHALLSASSASRWLACTPSPKLEETYEDSTSVFAEEGTLAHELCDISLKLHLKEIKKTEYNKLLKKIKEHDLFSDEMLTHADDYVAYVTSLTKKEATVLVETKLDFSEYVPDGFGTGDAVVIEDNIMHVIDFKYGKGHEVSAEDNPQMKLYALGAIHEFDMIYDFDKVHLHIYQPRINNYSEWETTKESLEIWGNEKVIPSAKKAFNGEGELCAGEHCTFCKHRARCKAMMNYVNETVSSQFENEKGELDTTCLNENDFKMILSRIKLIKSWLGDVEDYCIENILNGTLNVPGYKVVEGRSNRVYADPDKVVEVLVASGYPEATLFEKKLLTITKLEKEVGKNKFNELVGEYVDKPQGKPTVVEIKDKRPAITLAEQFDKEN